MTPRRELMRIAHHVTWFLGIYFPKAIPLVFVVAYPKSGTTWVCHLVADYLRLPFPLDVLLPIGFPAVVHGHERVRKSYRRGVYVLRDGRDAEVSKYFAATRDIPDGDHPRLTARQRRRFPGLVNKADVRKNLPRFIETDYRRPIASQGVNWGDHVRSYFEVKNPNMVLIRYEDLVSDGAVTLATAMSQLTGEEPDLDRAQQAVDRSSFRKQKERAGSLGTSPAHFFRSGQVGEWKKYFSREAGEVFDRYWGDVLIAAGYEKDHAWVQSLED